MKKIRKKKNRFINEEENYIRFIDFKTFFEFVRENATYIRRLTFSDPTDSIPISIDKWAEAHHIVYEHCSKSLHEFDMGRISDEKLKKIPMKNLNIFQNVEILGFVIEEEINKRKLSDLFPCVRDMEIRLEADVDYSFINCRLNDLKLMNFDFSPDDWTEPIIGLIKNNPKILFFKIIGDEDTSEIRKAISKYSVNLKELHITSDDECDELCSFGNVIDARLVLGPLFHIDKLSFPKLNLLEIKYYSGKRDDFNTFFRNHQNLKDLTFLNERTEEHISTSDFNQLTAGLWELEAVRVESIDKKNYNEEDLYNFIIRHPNLKKFIFPVYNEADETNFRNEFGKTWTIETKGKDFPRQLVFRKGASNP